MSLANVDGGGVLPPIPCPFWGWATYRVHTISSRADFSSAVLAFKTHLLSDAGVAPTTSDIFDIDPGVHESSVYGLARATQTIVSRMPVTCKEKEGMYASIRLPDWRLKLCGTEFFVIAMSCCYRPSHPRYIPGRTLIIFQPEAQFSYFNITTGDRRLWYTEIAKAHFRRSGRRYFAHHTNKTPKSLRFVLTEEGDGIEWWKVKALDDALP